VKLLSNFKTDVLTAEGKISVYLSSVVRDTILSNITLFNSFISKGDWRGWVDAFYKYLGQTYDTLIGNKLGLDDIKRGGVLSKADFIGRCKITAWYLLLASDDARLSLKGFIPKPVLNIMLRDCIHANDLNYKWITVIRDG